MALYIAFLHKINPVDYGPLIAFPPLKITAEKPISMYFFKLFLGGIYAAASQIIFVS